MEKLAIAQHAITPVMGRALWLLKKLTMAVESEPMPICRAPSNADALPAILVNGASERAEVLGNVNPWQLRKINIKSIVLNNSVFPVIAPTKSNDPVML